MRGFLHLPANRTVDPTCIPILPVVWTRLRTISPQATWESGTCVVTQRSRAGRCPPHANCTLQYVYDDDGVGSAQPVYTCGNGEPSGGWVPNATHSAQGGQSGRGPTGCEPTYYGCTDGPESCTGTATIDFLICDLDPATADDTDVANGVLDEIADCPAGCSYHINSFNYDSAANR